MKGKSTLGAIGLGMAILSMPVSIPFCYGVYLKHRAQRLCDAIKVGSTMDIQRLKDDSTVEFNHLKELAKSYGSSSYGIRANYFLLNFNVSYFGYSCVVKTESNVVADKKVCLLEGENDKQCFDLYEQRH